MWIRHQESPVLSGRHDYGWRGRLVPREAHSHIGRSEVVSTERRNSRAPENVGFIKKLCDGVGVSAECQFEFAVEVSIYTYRKRVQYDRQESLGQVDRSRHGSQAG